MKKRIGYFLLAVVLAFCLWYYVISVVSPGSEETFYNIPVILEGESALEDRGYMITSVGNTSVTLTLSGNRTDLNQLTSSNITIKANLASLYDPGQNIHLDYSVSYPGTVANNAFVVEGKNPAYITVSIEKRSYKDVPVNVVYSGTVAEGFTTKIDEEALDFETVRISGPASVVENIAQARIDVSLAGLTETIDQSYKFTLCDENSEPVDSELITVYQQEVRLTLPILQVKTLPLRVNVIDGAGATEKTTSITIEPKEIKVCGSAAALEDLDEIVLGTIELADYATAADIEFNIVLPDNITNMNNITEATVSLKFPALSTKTFTIDNIQMINIPEGLTVELTTQVLDVTLRGPSSEIASITAEDITVTVDFTGAEAGTSSRKVQITISTDFPGTGALGSYSVYATVMEEGAEE